MPELHLDYMFMGDEQDAKTLAILVARERGSRATLATVVPRKGVEGWIPKRLMAWLREIGLEYHEIIVKTDNEPALVALVEAWSRYRAAKGGGKMIMEHSPVRSSKSNGVVEKAVQEVQGMVRTMRSALEDKWGMKMSMEHPIWAWLIEYSAFVWSRYRVGKDGKTAYERINGEEVQSGWHGIWRRSTLETTTRRRTFGQIDMYVGRRNLRGRQGLYWRDDGG